MSNALHTPPAPPAVTEAPETARRRKPWKRFVLALYLSALVASCGVRSFEPAFTPRPDQQTLELSAVDQGRTTGHPVYFSYVDSQADDTTGKEVIVVLHGSPVASVSMMGLHRALAEGGAFRVITPDLPGFGGSSIAVPDYSVEAHAHYLIQALDSLGIEHVNLLAYSMGGGVALEFDRLAPERVASLVMLSAIGVQELELTGDYYLNHAVHGLQLGGLWMMREGLPHFGWLDNAILGVSYARNFFDTDQRPLRRILSEYDGPMEIIHGTNDFLVHYDVALEHHRLVPQSVLRTIEGGDHGLAFQRPDTLARLVSSFVRQVADGGGMTRSDVSAEDQKKAEQPFDPGSIPPASGFNLVILLILIVAATLVSEDLACIGAGLLAARGAITFTAGLSAAFSGIVLGDVLLYALGRGFGRALVRRFPFRIFLSEQKLERGSSWFRRRGIRVIFASRFVPGSRLPTYVAAGVLKAPFWSFLFYFMIASIVWTPLLVGLSSVLGNEILRFYDAYEAYAIWVAVGLVAVIWLFVHVGLAAMSRSGRRRLASRWRRFVRWEFWPAPVFYIPVVTYVAIQALKNHSLTVFTAANPGMPQGGFVGESKSSILASMERAHAPVARFTLIQPDENALRAAGDFVQEAGLHFPVVLKPDVGERGAGVVIARNHEEMKAYFLEAQSPVIVQEFVPGREFGVFYVRFPSSESGYIFSVTDKRLPYVTGDGKRTLEELIQDDERVNAMAPLHFREHAGHLRSIPSEGERYGLVDVGTHCRGAVFLDGARVVTRDMTAAFDDISRRIEGFYFGRYDVITESEEALKRGKGFTIIELNGVTSEATSIYDPSHSVFDAYRTLFRQWRLAFEIGRENRRLGAEPSGVRELIRLVRRHKLS